MKKSKIEIEPILYGESVLSEDKILENGDADKEVPISFKIHLVKLDDQLILVDAGCETMPGFVMKNFVGSVKTLESKGIYPEDISKVIISHAHHDHIECVKYFKNAVIYIQKEEYEAGKIHFTPDLRVETFEDFIMLDDKIKVLKIGGHTAGSCIVEINDGKMLYVIAGDECYSRKNLEQRISTGTSYCPKRSHEFIEKYSSQKYTVLLCHDY